MDKEKGLNSALAIFLVDKAFTVPPAAHGILVLALAAIFGRLIWTWIQPRWARYPATVAALVLLALLIIPGMLDRA